MKGRPDADWPTQQVDYVRVNSGGEVIGKDGNIIRKSETIKKPSHEADAHIPLSEYINWKEWNKK